MSQIKTDEVKELLRECAYINKEGDGGEAHIRADKIITTFLIELGYKDVVDVYNSFSKWYE